MPTSLNHLSQELAIPTVALMSQEQKSSEEGRKQFFEAVNMDECPEITFTIKLSHVLYDLYSAHLEKPVAPLLVKKQESELQEMAKSFFDETGVLEVSDKMKSVLEKVLSDDEKFKGTPVHAFYKDKDGTQKVVPLAATVVYSAQGVLNSLLSLFEEKEESEKSE